MAVLTPGLEVGRQAVPVSEDHSLDSVAEIEFRKDATDVGLDGRFGDEQFGRDFGVGHPAGEQFERFAFPAREPAQFWAGGWLVCRRVGQE